MLDKNNMLCYNITRRKKQNISRKEGGQPKQAPQKALHQKQASIDTIIITKTHFNSERRDKRTKPSTPTSQFALFLRKKTKNISK